MKTLSLATGVATLVCGGTVNAVTDNSFNPQISLILDGRYAAYEHSPEDYAIAGFQLGGESAPAAEGFSLGHSELTLSANIDRYFFGKSTLALAEHEGETEVELEEAYIQTLGLGHGLGIKFGRFLSSIGYQNIQHRHAWDFADAPLPYAALLGGYLADDGVQFSYLAPSDLYIELSAELLAGNAFPAGGNETGGIGARVLSVSLGDDIGMSHSWQLGLSHYQADDIGERSGAAHMHDAEVLETPVFAGDSRLQVLDLVYKWSPDGNPRQRQLKFAFEYFERNEQGRISLLNSGPPLETTGYSGDQSGWYASLVYRFLPRWRGGVRVDRLHSDNRGDDADVLDEAGLSSPADDPQRASLMLEWLPSEFSRLRLQFNEDQSTAVDDRQWLLQYTFSLGAHGAHVY